MTITFLVEELLDIAKYESDTETAHSRADGLLLEFINDREVDSAYKKIKKWYA